MKKFLPHTDVFLLRVVVITLAVCLAGLSGRVVVVAVLDRSLSLEAALFASAFVATAIGLWRMQSWARAASVVVIWLLVIVVPLGVINPFSAMDQLGPNPTSTWDLVWRIYPWVALGVFVLHVLGKHKAEFSRRAVTP